MSGNSSHGGKRGKPTPFWICMALACATPGLAGCSFLFTTPPPADPADSARPRSSKIECTSSKAAPIADTVIGALQVAGTVAAATVPDSVHKDLPISRGEDVVTGIHLSALFIGSAIYGYSATGKCKDLKSRPVSDVALADPETMPVPR